MAEPERDRGAVTAELAAALPAAVIVLALCIGAVMVVANEVRLTDTAATAARMLGRGDPESMVRAALATAGGVSFEVERSGELVCAAIEQPVGGGPFALPGVRLRARGCALGPDPALGVGSNPDG